MARYFVSTIVVALSVLVVMATPSHAVPFDGLRLKYSIVAKMAGTEVSWNMTVKYTAYNETHFRIVEAVEGFNGPSVIYYERKGARIARGTMKLLNTTIAVERYDPYWLPLPLMDSCKQGNVDSPVTLKKVGTASITVAGRTTTAYVYEGNASDSRCKYYYDEWSGILLKMESSGRAAGTVATTVVVLTSTNAQIGPPPSASFPWTWILLIVGVAASVVIAVLLIRRRRPERSTSRTACHSNNFILEL